MTAIRVTVSGQVQGVGFRPFVYRLATECALTGSVGNAAGGAVIEAEGEPADLTRFQQRLVAEAPEAATIEGIASEPIEPGARTDFVIVTSTTAGVPRVRVPRDLATCADCRAEVRSVEGSLRSRRRGYPFTTCTACGPRYSLIEGLPYDRPATTLRGFTMCPACQGEYEDPADRRFHAQPNACPACGPQIALWDHAGRVVAGPETALPAAVKLLRDGRILALKGVGGFQLLVRADAAAAVARLRQRKGRPSKPLAVMLPLADPLLVRLGAVERALLTSPANPIVLVERAAVTLGLAEGVAPRVGTLGLFLPTTPLHLLLLDALQLPVVATSGNAGGEPLATDERAARAVLAEIADAFLVHDRPISRGVDDSVVRVIAGQPVTLRLGRGYAPLPLPALEEIAAGMPPVLATGGHQKAALALWNGEQAILGQHLGDLDHPAARAGFRAAVRDLSHLYSCVPQRLACDAHPDYFTSGWAAEQGVPSVRVQHHHAHAVAGMVEHHLLDREVLAVTWDGTGLGPDGTIWGGEILRVGPRGCTRVASLMPFPLPGGDAAVRHPNRISFGLLCNLLGTQEAVRANRWLQRLGLTARAAALLAGMIHQGVNTPTTSSVGRLFDAVAALVLGVTEVSYEGEAALWLEAVAEPGAEPYPLPGGAWRPLLGCVLEDVERGIDPGRVAGRFHSALAAWAVEAVAGCPLPDVVLAGGCFQNRLLTERIAEGLRTLGRRVHTPGRIPPGDGGLAVGQLGVALLQQGR